MKNAKNLGLALFAVVAGASLLPTDASAQFGRRHRLVYAADWQVRPLVDTAERQSNDFRAYFESHDAKGRLGRHHDNKYLKAQIRMMDESFERLRGKADDHKPGVGRPDLKDALMRARNVDREIYYAPDTNKTIREWNDFRVTLNQLASLYQLPGL